jgi:hypothetical protein
VNPTAAVKRIETTQDVREGERDVLPRRRAPHEASQVAPLAVLHDHPGRKRLNVMIQELNREVVSDLRVEVLCLLHKERSGLRREMREFLERDRCVRL